MKKKLRRLLWWVVLLAVAVLLFIMYVLPRPVTISSAALRAMPLILQTDYNETVAVFGGEDKSVATSGCGAVSVAMVTRYLTGRDVEPVELMKWAVEENQYFGDGLSHETLITMLSNHRLDGEWVENDALGRVRKALERGYPVIAHMGPGTFTQGGHYIVLTGIDGDDMVSINDPSSVERSGQTWPLKQIQSELRRENSFLLVRPK